MAQKNQKTGRDLKSGNSTSRRKQDLKQLRRRISTANSVTLHLEGNIECVMYKTGRRNYVACYNRNTESSQTIGEALTKLTRHGQIQEMHFN